MGRGDTTAIALIVNVVAEHTNLSMPTTPTALAGCLLTADADFADVFDDRELGRRCVDRLLTDVDESIVVEPDELERALFGA